jgi:hypothetical protein
MKKNSKYIITVCSPIQTEEIIKYNYTIILIFKKHTHNTKDRVTRIPLNIVGLK